ncbi:MAG: reverse transcriptase family protein [gamma proteobacterium symbiont of Lucinoma myriamae]|nr:reverse transcriptase family protein [gamma proteobacterium symbiont of Lucinoma myriamae]
MTVLNKHAPIKSKRVKRETQPEWFNVDIKNAIRNRDTHHQKKDWSQYKYWRNKTNSLIKLYKKDFFSKAVAENKDTTYIWKHIKNLGRQSEKSRMPTELIIDNQINDKQQDVVNKLNAYFANISETLKSSQNVEPHTDYEFNRLKNYIDILIPNDVIFRIPDMKLPDLISIIKTIDVTKATGLDGLSPKILKLSAEVVGPILLKLINISFQSGQFPDILKLAKLLPIHKGGADNDPSNYRPISILSVLSKVIEKHVTKHMFAFLNKYQVLHKSQSGFRKRYSCSTALINLVDRWLKSIDNGEVIGAIFFDLRKAFDVVDHELLLQKLSFYKFSNLSLNWVKSYLANRKQCIVERDISSLLQTVKSGVPQGSVLGPVLFLLFINDMPLFTSEVCVDVYADDTTMHAASKNYKTVENKLQVGANGFKNWCRTNKMYIHLQKTMQMTIGTRRNLTRTEQIKVYLDNDLIQTVNDQKLLGVIIDNSLSWDKQIDVVCLNITRRITLLKLLSKYIDKSNMIKYYNSYILPILDYGCMIWGRCTLANTNRLLKLQKRAARIILKADIMTPSQTMFNELQWLPFPARLQFHTCSMVYKALNDLAPDYIRDLFTKTSEAHTRNLRSVDNELLRVPNSKTTSFENSFTVSAAKQWNEIPFDIRTVSSLQSFKNALKTYLLKK